MQWEKKVKFSNGYVFKTGRFSLGETTYIEFGSGSDRRWKAAAFLPGIEVDLGMHHTEKIAREVVEKWVFFWIEAVNEKKRYGSGNIIKANNHKQISHYR